MKAPGPSIVEQTQPLCAVQWGKNINTRHYFSYGLRVLRKSRKRFEPSLAIRTIPEMTNYLVIQEFCLVGRNDFVIASNTAHSKHEHRTSAFLCMCRRWQVSSGPDHLAWMNEVMNRLAPSSIMLDLFRRDGKSYRPLPLIIHCFGRWKE